ncbi:MAG: hypothetical protein KAZ26_22335, partial [Caldilineaceae bacterium]|nr:hypothetical protein [Caldilineaceae bacterium]
SKPVLFTRRSAPEGLGANNSAMICASTRRRTLVRDNFALAGSRTRLEQLIPELFAPSHTSAGKSRTFPLRVALTLLATIAAILLAWPHPVLADGIAAPALAESLAAPGFWYLLAAGMALLVPAGLVLIGAAGLSPERAWDAALGGLGAVGLAALAYWAVGFALQFGGVGLAHVRPELADLVWEWSALPAAWGTDWGMAGLSGWFLSGPSITPLAYALFLAHLPWAITAALLPVLALRGRAPAAATLVLALVTGGIIYPLAGNWVQGGGWLAALGRNLGLGHGLVDFGGAGTVFLVASTVALAALWYWVPRPPKQAWGQPTLPPVHLPLLAVVGAFLIMAGSIGWSWSNPLQIEVLGEIGPLRGSANAILYAAGGLLAPLLYTWFVTGSSDPLFTARGLVAGMVAGLATGPFVSPPGALIIGVLAGVSVPLVTYVVDQRFRLDDRAGIVAMGLVPALLGLTVMGLWADGVVGSGWNVTGVGDYLGVAGQGVSGIFVASGFQADFPGQLQAQLIGLVSLTLWGSVSGALLSLPLGLIFRTLRPVQADDYGHNEIEYEDDSGYDLSPLDSELAALAGDGPQRR